MAKSASEKTDNFTTAEAARRLRLSVITVRRRVLAGDIRAWRLGRGWRIPRAEIERIEATSAGSPGAE